MPSSSKSSVAAVQLQAQDLGSTFRNYVSKAQKFQNSARDRAVKQIHQSMRNSKRGTKPQTPIVTTSTNELFASRVPSLNDLQRAKETSPKSPIKAIPHEFSTPRFVRTEKTYLPQTSNRSPFSVGNKRTSGKKKSNPFVSNFTKRKEANKNLTEDKRKEIKSLVNRVDSVSRSLGDNSNTLTYRELYGDLLEGEEDLSTMKATQTARFITFKESLCPVKLKVYSINESGQLDIVTDEELKTMMRNETIESRLQSRLSRLSVASRSKTTSFMEESNLIRTGLDSFKDSKAKRLQTTANAIDMSFLLLAAIRALKTAAHVRKRRQMQLKGEKVIVKTNVSSQNKVDIPPALEAARILAQSKLLIAEIQSRENTEKELVNPKMSPRVKKRLAAISHIPTSPPKSARVYRRTPKKSTKHLYKAPKTERRRRKSSNIASVPRLNLKVLPKTPALDQSYSHSSRSITERSARKVLSARPSGKLVDRMTPQRVMTKNSPFRTAQSSLKIRRSLFEK
ncbi:hypothetical protein PCE1_002540 [Barthelona sp. PCE]